MASIFISYRRDDTEGHAGRLLDELRKRLGPEGVFLDVEGIGAGLKFRQVIQAQLASCKVVLVLIGKRWIDARDASGGKRLDNNDDVLRYEIAMAIERGIRVVPVLMHGARLPEASELPEDLRPLLDSSAFELRHDKWSSDVKLLMKELATTVPRLANTETDREAGQVLTRTSLQVWLASVVAMVVAYEIFHMTLNWHEAFLFLAWLVIGLSLGTWHAARVCVNVVRDVILGFAIALSGAVAMSVDGLFYDQPFLPPTEAEWHYTVKHMAVIMLSFVAGGLWPLLVAKKRALRKT